MRLVAFDEQMNEIPRNRAGSLSVVGIGISLGQTTLEARSHIESADVVFYVASNPIATRWLMQLNSRAESLYSLYEEGKPRARTYVEMADRIVDAVRAGKRVCAVFYGHPGVFVDPSHRAIRLARSEGYRAVMLPGVSAEDLLFADLGFDPATSGCQSYEASDFLIYNRRFDPQSYLILWQVGVIGVYDFSKRPDARVGLEILVEKLCPSYSIDHEVIVFEGSMLPVFPSRIESVPLGKLVDVPHCSQAHPDLGIIRRLGMAKVFTG
jgi:uncharacterized protein YabN with tetrapyrrole methylase and pyrophosphatase domain